MPAKANSGRSSESANHTTSFFLVSVFGSGAYSAKLFAGTRLRVPDNLTNFLATLGARLADLRALMISPDWPLRGDQRSSQDRCEPEPKIIRNQPRRSLP